MASVLSWLFAQSIFSCVVPVVALGENVSAIMAVDLPDLRQKTSPSEPLTHLHDTGDMLGVLLKMFPTDRCVGSAQ